MSTHAEPLSSLLKAGLVSMKSATSAVLLPSQRTASITTGFLRNRMDQPFSFASACISLADSATGSSATTGGAGVAVGPSSFGVKSWSSALVVLLSLAHDLSAPLASAHLTQSA